MIVVYSLTHSVASTVCGYTGHRLLHRRARSCKGLRVCQVGTTRPIRRLWRVLHDQFHDSPHALSSPLPCHGDTEVDARRNAGSGEPIAVDADALGAGLGAELDQGPWILGARFIKVNGVKNIISIFR